MDDAERHQLDLDMARLADGDRDAFTPVFRMLWPVLRGFCGRRLPEMDADDAAQQVMEKLVAQSSRYDSSRPALPWALAIAGWECRTLRKRTLRRREEPLDGVPEGRASDSPEDAVEIRQLLDAAERALGELSPTDREAIVSAYSGDAGARGEVPAATLRKRRERALSRLRTAWRKLYGN